MHLPSSPLSLRQFVEKRLSRMFPRSNRHESGSPAFTLYYGLRQKWGSADIAEWKLFLRETEPPFLELVCVTIDQRADILVENIVYSETVHSLGAWRAFECRMIEAVHRPCPAVEADWTLLEEASEEA